MIASSNQLFINFIFDFKFEYHFINFIITTNPPAANILIINH